MWNKEDAAPTFDTVHLRYCTPKRRFFSDPRLTRYEAILHFSERGWMRKRFLILRQCHWAVGCPALRVLSSNDRHITIEPGPLFRRFTCMSLVPIIS